MKRLFTLLLTATLVLSNINISIVKSNSIESKIKEPNWKTYDEGQEFSTLPYPAPYTTGFYSSNMYNEVDYKQSEDRFYKLAKQLKSDGFVEVFYETNPTIPVSYTEREKGALTLQETFPTGIKSYDQFKNDMSLSFDISNGQWLIDNGYYSRYNQEVKLNVANRSLDVTKLLMAPWGEKGNLTNADRDEFLMMLGKVAFGIIESRPILFESNAYRYAKGVRWYKIKDANDQVIGYRYHEETESEASESISRSGETKIDRKAKDNFVYQRVSDINPYSTNEYEFRGEFVTNVEANDYATFHRYNRDLFSYVTPNVPELYFVKLLSNGILDYNESFFMENLLSGKVKTTLNIGDQGDTFEFKDTFRDKIKQEYDFYGYKDPASNKIKYPAYAPELGSVLNSDKNSYRDLNVDIITDKVLGETFEVANDKITFKVDQTILEQLKFEVPETKFMKNTIMTNISALRLIERVLRLKEKNMSDLESSIIAQKYGAKYLENITNEDDRKTVSFLIAHGIIDFENFKEYSTLYSILSREFCYTLLYRLANPAARTDFSKIMLTDSNTTLGLPKDMQNYQNALVQSTPTVVDGMVVDGILKYDPTNPNSKELSLVSSVFVETVEKSNSGNPIHHVILNVDDPIKYIYDGLPLAAFKKKTDNEIDPANLLIVEDKNPWGDPFKPDSGEHYMIYPENRVGSKQQDTAMDIAKERKKFLDNYEQWGDIIVKSGNTAEDPTGILDIWKLEKDNRYGVRISIATRDEESAKTFVLANLKPMTSGMFNDEKSSVVGSVVTSNETLMMAPTNDVAPPTIDVDVSSSTVSNVQGNVAVSTNKVISGDIKQEIGETTMVSQELMLASSANMSVDQVGSTPIVKVDSSTYKKENTPVYTNTINTGESLFKRDMTYKLLGDEDITEEFVLVKNKTLGDVIYADKVFKYINDQGKTIEVSGKIVVKLNLTLPSEMEQSSLANSINIVTRESEAYNWIYEEPKTETLKEYWDYNLGVTSAVLRYLGVNASVKSGYLYPEIKILLDKPKSIIDGKELTDEQQDYIKATTLKEIGKSIPSEWYTKYLGLKDKYNLSGKETGITELGDSKKIFIPTPITKENYPLWASVYFETLIDPREIIDSYLKSRIALPSIDVQTIVAFSGPNKIYGNILPDEAKENPTERDLSQNISYAISDLGELYVTVGGTNLVKTASDTLVKTVGLAISYNSSDKKYQYGDKGFSILQESPIEYMVVSDEYIQATVVNGEVLEAKTLTPIIEYNKIFINGIFGMDVDNTADERISYNFSSFDTGGRENLKNDNKIALIEDNILQVYSYLQDDSTFSKRVAKVVDGETIMFRPYVRLYKSTWSTDPINKNFKWSKKFLGANYSYYKPINNLLFIESDVLSPTSESRVKYKDLPEISLKIGELDITKKKDMGYALLPFNSKIIDNGKLSNTNLNNLLTAATTAVNIDDKSYQSMDYITPNLSKYSRDNISSYDKTLVTNDKNELLVATKDSVVSYTPASNVKTIALDVKVDEDTVFTVEKDDKENIVAGVIDSKQEITPTGTSTEDKTETPSSKLPTGISIDSLIVQHKGLENASNYFDRLVKYTDSLRTQNVIAKLVYFVTLLCIVFSLFMVIARVLRDTPFISSITNEVWETSGVDILAVMSLGQVNSDFGRDIIGWGRLMITSFSLVVLPSIILVLMESFNMKLL